MPAEEYRASVEDAIEFLEGRESELVERLRTRMDEAAAALRFEDAARIRDQLVAVERSLEKQRVLMADDADRDVFGLHREGPDLVVTVLSMRGGKLQDARTYPFREQEFPAEEIALLLPRALLRAEPGPGRGAPAGRARGRGRARGGALGSARTKQVRLLTPQRGAKADLLEVAARNAVQGFKSWHEKDERREEALAALTRALHLDREPRWMECYDISTFQGALAVGSGVSMRDGEPDKASYRRYKVKGVAGQDDFAMLHEVITRRLRRALAESAFPDLLVIDGGKGQLNAALAAARDLGIATRPEPGIAGVPFVQMVGLAKSRLVEFDTARVISARSRRRPVAGVPRWWMRPTWRSEASSRGGAHPRARLPAGRKDPVVLRQNSAELFLLTRLRDEAHRFAITFHRKLRRSRNFQSVLEEIPGIGAGRRKALLRSLGSLRRIKEASAAELAAVEGFGAKAAQAVWDVLPSAATAPSTGAEMASTSRALAEEGVEAILRSARRRRGGLTPRRTKQDGARSRACGPAPVVDELCAAEHGTLAGPAATAAGAGSCSRRATWSSPASRTCGRCSSRATSATTDLADEHLHYYIGATLDRALHQLEEQVRRGIAFAERHDFETCASLLHARSARRPGHSWRGSPPCAGWSRPTSTPPTRATRRSRSRTRPSSATRASWPSRTSASRTSCSRPRRAAHPTHDHRARARAHRDRHPPRRADRREASSSTTAPASSSARRPSSATTSASTRA